MFRKIWANLKAQPPAETVITDPVEVDRLYSYWRKRIALTSFFGYVVFYLVRKNISVALPEIGKEFGYSNTELGVIGTALYVTYGIGKFVNGVLGDMANIRWFSAIGLFLSSLTAILFANAHSIFMLAFFWGLNGWFQSMGNPPFARAMCHWFTISERGTKFGIWSTCHQVGTWLIMVTGGWIVAQFGWRAIFYIPAVIGFVYSLVLVWGLRDTPESMGLPHVEKYKCDSAIDTTEAEKLDMAEKQEGFFQIFLKYVLLNKYVWLLGLINTCVYIVRFGTVDWMVKFLTEAKGANIEKGAVEASMIPLFGIAGMILAGWMSDKIFKARRAPATVIFFIGCAVATLAIFYTPKELVWLETLFIGLTGFFTYGPQFLIAGAAAIDFGSRRAAATATGFIGSFGYLGAVFSSLGSGIIVDRWGWVGGIYFWTAAAILGAALSAIMWNAKPKHM